MTSGDSTAHLWGAGGEGGSQGLIEQLVVLPTPLSSSWRSN